LSGAEFQPLVIQSPGRRLGLLWRIQQFVQALWARSDPRVDDELRRLLANDAQWRLLARLAPFDRAHHLRAYYLLVDAGYRDPDLLRAVLLHDVGKADARGRVRAAHRALAVLLRRIAPRVYLRLTARAHRGPLHGLYLARHHAALGAQLAWQAGASERSHGLIAHHEDTHPADDPELEALIRADEAAIT
jgi:hypothetical protein